MGAANLRFRPRSGNALSRECRLLLIVFKRGGQIVKYIRKRRISQEYRRAKKWPIPAEFRDLFQHLRLRKRHSQKLRDGRV